MTKFNKTYWETRYENDQTQWDLGKVSPPLKCYIDQLKNKDLKILIPGGGHNYEAEYLWNKGFKNIVVADIAKQPLQNFKSRISNFPSQHLLNQNFFDIEDQFDLILEQTFFCALEPSLRNEYVIKTHSLLKSKGILSGLLFDFPLTDEGPPFGGNSEMYIQLFEAKFNIKTLKRATNSIKKRKDKELFFIFEKKQNGLNKKHHLKS